MSEGLNQLVGYAEKRIGRDVRAYEVNILDWILHLESDDRDEKLRLLDLFIRTHTNN